jgi:hypothetical protein
VWLIEQTFRNHYSALHKFSQSREKFWILQFLDLDPQTNLSNAKIIHTLTKLAFAAFRHNEESRVVDALKKAALQTSTQASLIFVIDSILKNVQSIKMPVKLLVDVCKNAK